MKDTLILIPLLLLPAACAEGGPAPVVPQAAAGDATPTTAVLWAQTPNVGAVEFVVLREADQAVAATATADVTDPMLPVKVRVAGLEPHVRYGYTATDSAGVAMTGRFLTPAGPGQRLGLRFGVLADCRGDRLPSTALSNAAARDLDFFVQMGDMIYADVKSPAVPAGRATSLGQFREKHREVYSPRLGLNTLQELRSSSQLYATIDDHEVVNDWAGGAPPASDPRFLGTTEAYVNETPLYRVALEAFLEYNPVEAEVYGATGDARTAGKPRLYRYRAFGDDAAIFLLDARSFRDEALADADPTDAASVDDFLARSFDPSRTMLGAAQLADLEADLLDAEGRGITWKFVLVPEPIQNFGILEAADRFEGYAAERSTLLRFVRESALTNVVFVAADFHGTLVNNLTYQDASPSDPQVPVESFEVVASAIASNPLGPSEISHAASLGALSPADKALYDSLATTEEKDSFFQVFMDGQITSLGYDPLGLAGSSIPAVLDNPGYGYVYAHAYGWTEFEIDPLSRELTVTVYGIPAYTDPMDGLDSEPTVLTRFRVAAR